MAVPPLSWGTRALGSVPGLDLGPAASLPGQRRGLRPADLTYQSSKRHGPAVLNGGLARRLRIRQRQGPGHSRNDALCGRVVIESMTRRASITLVRNEQRLRSRTPESRAFAERVQLVMNLTAHP